MKKNFIIFKNIKKIKIHFKGENPLGFLYNYNNNTVIFNFLLSIYIIIVYYKDKDRFN